MPRNTPKKSRSKQLPIEHNGFYPYLVRFMDWSKVIKRQTEHALPRREGQLRAFIAWCDERDLHDPKAVTKPILERYQRHLFYRRKADGNPLSHHTQRGMLVSVKMFFRWLATENHIPSNPASEMLLPKQYRTLPRYILSHEDLARLFNLPDLGRPEGVRDRAILELLYATGIRRSELCNLDLYSIDMTRQTVFIKEGKGGADRVVPVGERALAWIRKYLDEARPELTTAPHSQALFLSAYGQGFSGAVLSEIVRHYLNQADIRHPGSCHLFRHACATHMLDNGADVRFIQAMLGHVKLDTTTIYTRVSIEKLKQIHSATHPAQLKTVMDANGEERMALLATLEQEADDDR